MENNTNPPIIIKMQALRSMMTKSEQRVMDAIIANPHEVIYASVAELAAQSEVSDPTVVRMCKKLGLNGYQDLKITLAKDLVNPLQSINEDITVNDSSTTIAAKVFQSTIRALQFTHDTLIIPDVEAAVQLISQAERILIVGMGNSRAISIDLEHKLMRLNKDARAHSDPHFATIAASYFTKKDLLFCISHSGSSREIVDLAAQAVKQNVPVISLTNTGISPLSKLSTISLHTSAAETRYRIIGLNSRIAQLAIIDTLYTFLAMRSGDMNMRVEDAMKSHKY